ncbi:MAG: dTDP-4-dehydrorhamnose reductase [Sphingomonadales bacterium]|jgi:dTDP-4-dehydrorhamnose reductase|nr:dTDP-4-dehydrorhamnose reductase [Sphingomonadales bacterium]
MRALILGAGGQVGRALAAAAPEGCDLVALERADCDVGDEAAVRAGIAEARPEIVFNAAAYTAVDRAEAEPEAARRLNAEAPGFIAAAARAAGARLVHLSSDFVFGGAAERPRRPGDATQPEGVYARTKLDGEKAALAADPDALLVRAAWVYAPVGQNFVNTMLRLIGEKDEVRVVADQIGTPTWAPRLAGALWRLAALGARGIHHYTDSGVASWYDFAVAIGEEALAADLIDRAARIVPIATEDYPTPAKRPAYSVLDKKATWALLGEPAPHWRANLRANLRELSYA